MTNGEKYGDEIKKQFINDTQFCEEFVQKKVLQKNDCKGIVCAQCKMIQMLWLNEECKESEVDWSKVPVDTKVIVSNKSFPGLKRYFAKYEDGKVFAFNDGRTSFTADDGDMTSWKFAKLAEVEDEKP